MLYNTAKSLLHKIGLDDTAGKKMKCLIKIMLCRLLYAIIRKYIFRSVWEIPKGFSDDIQCPTMSNNFQTLIIFNTNHFSIFFTIIALQGHV